VVLAAALAAPPAGSARAATAITIRYDDAAARAELERRSSTHPGVRPAGDAADAARAERLLAALGELRREALGLQARVARRISTFFPTGTDLEATVRLAPDESAAPDADASVVLLPVPGVVRAGAGALDVDAVFARSVRGVYAVAFRAAGGPSPVPPTDSAIGEELAAAYGAAVVGEVWRGAGGRWNGTDTRLRLEAWVPPATWTRSGIEAFLGLLGRMQLEGGAALAAAAPRTAADTGQDPTGVTAWSHTAADDWSVLAEAASALEHGATGFGIDRIAARGFAPDGPLVRVGYRMARRIDRRTGRRTLVAVTTGGPIAFTDAYLATHPNGPDEIDADTARTLRTVSREIRAVAAFRPLE